MAGYFRQGMSEDEQRALSATLDQATRDKLLADAIAALPACWTQELNDCANLVASSSRFNCQVIADGWIGDYDKMQAAFMALPPCPPKKSSPWMTALKVTGGILLAGLAIKGLTSR